MYWSRAKTFELINQCIKLQKTNKLVSKIRMTNLMKTRRFLVANNLLIKLQSILI
jgi:23S rRNA C2498 (ribose-2'-O)-methylase RlmM